MKLNIKSMLAAGAIATALSATAQNTEAGYFLDDYTYRFQMNPAFGNSRGFVSMPALGNLNVGISGNLGVQDVLYNVNGKTVTFMHPDVSTAEAMKNLGNDKRFAVNLRETILAVGFKGIGGYNTISISARTDVGVKLPSSIFSFLKEGVPIISPTSRLALPHLLRLPSTTRAKSCRACAWALPSRDWSALAMLASTSRRLTWLSAPTTGLSVRAARCMST